MLNTIYHWLSGFYEWQFFIVFSGLIFLDTPRYILTSVGLIFYDSIISYFKPEKNNTQYLPSICAVLPCLNEDETIYQMLESIHGSYPFLEIIVIDDGSTDKTYELATKFASIHKNVLVIRRIIRGGKSSALNLALFYTKADVIITLDADSTLGENALFKIVQPMKDPQVAAVSGSVLIRNPFVNLCTRYQAYEYLNSILVGRSFKSRVNMLGISSGAFSAFKKEIVNRVKGWDSGPGEDADIVIRFRKLGYKIKFAPDAECLTNGPEKWKVLWKQRCRWDRSSIRYMIRKHRDLANPFNKNFKFSNFFLWWDVVYFNIICAYSFWIGMATYFFIHNNLIISALLFISILYACLGFIKILIIAYYSQNLKRDLAQCAVAPIYIFYAFYCRLIRSYSIIDELFNRSSYQDSFVPKYVREQITRW